MHPRILARSEAVYRARLAAANSGDVDACAVAVIALRDTAPTAGERSEWQDLIDWLHSQHVCREATA